MPSRTLSPAFTLASPQTGTTYPLYVESPDPLKDPGPWPVVFFTDGDDQFSAAVDAYRNLRAKAAVPPLLLIGVGYGASYTKPGNRRVRDYTPTPIATEADSGKAASFISFLNTTLWEEIERRYPVTSENRGIAGHSLGSLLGIVAAFDGSNHFTRILASAPSLWWDDRSVFNQVSALHARKPQVRARLYLSVGLEDSYSMTGDLALFETLLREKPFFGLEVVSRRFEGRNHYDVIGEAFADGLAVLYGR